MTIHRGLRIGGIEYTIKWIRGLEDGSTKLNGWIRYNESAIELDDNLSPQVQWVTLWHEILHGILTQAGYEKHDEAKLAALAYGIFDVLRVNPWLAPSLLDGEG